MASTFKNSLSLTGLSQSEAARFFDVRVDTVKNWCQNKTSPPQGVWSMLADRMRGILEAADNGADHMSLDGIDPRSWSNISVNSGAEHDLDMHAEEMAGAMALLMAIDDLSAVE